MNAKEGHYKSIKRATPETQRLFLVGLADGYDAKPFPRDYDWWDHKRQENYESSRLWGANVRAAGFMLPRSVAAGCLYVHEASKRVGDPRPPVRVLKPEPAAIRPVSRPAKRVLTLDDLGDLA